MCRFTLYQGPPLLLSALITEPENSLIHQSFHSHERAEPLNGDGFGLAWYVHSLDPAPALFRSITPAWNNGNLLQLARVVQSGCVLAHVRAATQVRSVSEANCHPFTCGPYAFMHNGDVGGFKRVRRPLLAELSDESFQAIQGQTDSEHAFAVFLDRIRGSGGAPTLEQMADALRATIEHLVELVGKYAPGEACYLNFAVSNGQVSVVSRFSTKEDHEGESLYMHRGRRYVCQSGACRMVESESGGGAVLVSSEPLSKDPGWERIPANHMIAFDGACNVRSIAI
jgi:predicted glutamine amidotransferase